MDSMRTEQSLLPKWATFPIEMDWTIGISNIRATSMVLRHHNLLKFFYLVRKITWKNILPNVHFFLIYFDKTFTWVSRFSFCASAVSLTISLNEWRSSIAWPYSRVLWPPPWAAYRRWQRRSEPHSTAWTVIRNTSQHKELLQLKW